MRRSLLCGILVAVIVSIDPACAARKSGTPITSRVKRLEISPEELRIRVRALIRPTLGIIEQNADRIRADADPIARRGALVWKIEATTTLLAALLRDDPVLAFGDAWGYTFQVQAFLASPEAEAAYGEFASRAARAMGEIEAELREFAGSLEGGLDVEGFEARVRHWADTHPIEGTLYRRPSMDGAVAKMMTEESGGAFAALGSLEVTTADIIARMDLYTMYLPRLSRWEAELAVNDLAGDIDVASLGADVDRFAHAADQVSALAAGAPDLIERERAAAFEAVRLERLAATRDLQAERRIVLDAIQRERIATLEGIEAMMQRLVDRSAGPLHATMRAETEDLVRSVEEMRKRLIDESAPALDQVVDHAFVRAVELLLIAFALGGLGAFLFVRFLRP